MDNMKYHKDSNTFHYYLWLVFSKIQVLYLK